MVATILASAEADQMERADTVEDMATFYAHLSNCDPYQDMIFAEVTGEVIGYARGYWWEESKGPRIYGFSGFLIPAWRRQGSSNPQIDFLLADLSSLAQVRRLAAEFTARTVNAAHPGMVASGIWSNPFGRLGALVKPFTRLAMRSPEQGAETIVDLATVPELAGVRGRYFVGREARSSSRASQDLAAASRAWQVSAALCGLTPDA